MDNNLQNQNLDYMFGYVKQKINRTMLAFNILCISFYLAILITTIVKHYVLTYAFVMLLVLGIYILLYIVNHILKMFMFVDYPGDKIKKLNLASFILSVFVAMLNFATSIMTIVLGFMLKGYNKTLSIVTLVFSFIIAILIFMVVLFILIFKGYAKKRITSMQSYFETLNISSLNFNDSVDDKNDKDK